MSGAPKPVARRLTATLFAGVAISRTGYIAAITVVTLVAKDMLGSATWAGLPGAVSVLGSALGSTRLSALMERHGRRPGIAGGYAMMALGGAGAATATAIGSFCVLIVAMAVFGFGASADNLGRYAAAEVHPPARRGTAIAFVVWAGTIGSVVGPSLLGPAEDLGTALGIEPLAGGFLLAVIGALAAMAVIQVLLRPDPLTFADRGDPLEPSTTGRVPMSHAALTALTALAIGQVVMVVIMAMTPIHVRDHGHGLGTVGVIISAHTLGMFAVSPITGLLADRLGRVPVIVTGHLILAVSALLAAVADPAASGVLTVALFLLGLGWNFSFVGGSALLSDGLLPALRVRRQGQGDSVVWVGGAVASLASGFVLAASSYAVLCFVGAALTVVPLMVVTGGRRLAAQRSDSA